MPIPDVDIDYVRQQIDAVREQIGRDVSIWTAVRSACTQCTVSGFYDTFTDHSIFFTCPECAGSFWKDGFEETIITARVHWTGNEAITATPGGKFFSGDGYMHVEPEYHDLLVSCQNKGKVTVDGQDMAIIRINPVGAPEINRYRAILRGVGTRPETG